MIGGMLALAAITWSHAPERIPVHWNIGGEIDSYAGRFGGLLALPLIALGLYFFLLVIPLIDPERSRHPGFMGPFALIRTGTILVLAVIYGATHLLIRGIDVDMNAVVGAGIGALFFMIGIAMQRMPTEGPSALNTPWEIRDPARRGRVQNVCGRVFGATGIVIAVAGLINAALLFAATVGGAVLASGVILVYSYRASKM